MSVQAERSEFIEEPGGTHPNEDAGGSLDGHAFRLGNPNSRRLGPRSHSCHRWSDPSDYCTRQKDRCEQRREPAALRAGVVDLQIPVFRVAVQRRPVFERSSPGRSKPSRSCLRFPASRECDSQALQTGMDHDMIPTHYCSPISSFC